MFHANDMKERFSPLIDDVKNQSLERDHLIEKSDSEMRGSDLLIASCDLQMNNDRWMRPKIDNFVDMSFEEFCFFCNRNPKIIEESATGETSMKHPSWKGSLNVPSPWKAVYTTMFAALFIGIILALGVGFSTSCTYCGILSGVSFPFLVFLICFTTLTVYMSCYGGGLSSAQMPKCVNVCGFHRNFQANQLCRFVMSCFSSKYFDMYGFAMSSEASNRIEIIRKLNNGHGPDAGGICWLGDSEFNTWYHLDEDMRPYSNTNFNAGFGGSRCIDVYHHLQELCLDWNPKIVIFHCAGNDIDTDSKVTSGDICDRLLQIFHILSEYPSIEKIGYMLSSRRPIYTDEKWDFKIRIHTLVQERIQQNPKLKDIIKIIDLRDMRHPLSDFLQVDRAHLNKDGHLSKARVLIQKLSDVWPDIQA